MIRPVSVAALPGYRLHLRFADGTDGVIDLSTNVGRGVFAPLTDEILFRSVHLGEFGQIAWSDELEICPDAAYQEIVSQVSSGTAHARS